MSRKTKTDPTGQATARKRGTSALTSRLKAAERKVLSIFREIPKTRRTQTPLVNTATVIYDYELTALERDALRQAIAVILNDLLLETQGERPIRGWYWEKHVEQPYRQGTLEEVNRFNMLVAGAIAAGASVDVFAQQLDGPQFLATREYRDGLATKVATNFTDIKSLSNTTATQVMQQISLGIDAGDTPTTIANNIKERFDVSESSAKRIANTEINRAYNDAKLQAVSEMGRRTGLRPGVIHISALLVTTRDGHAKRHGNAYTPEDQAQWWNKDANRINCHCSTISVLIDRDGRVVDAETQEEIKAEREFFT